MIFGLFAGAWVLGHAVAGVGTVAGLVTPSLGRRPVMVAQYHKDAEGYYRRVMVERS